MVTENFIVLGSRIPVDGDGSHEVRRCLERQAMANVRHHIRKQRHPFVKAVVFLAVTCTCENWAVKKANSMDII